MDGRRDVLQRPLRVRGLALFILTISLVDAMPANPGSLKQNIMSGDLVSDSSSLGTSGNVMSPMGNPLQSSGQDPKLTPVRGTKDEQCSDKESLICKLEHDLKEAEQTLQCEINELQHALGQSCAAEKTSDRLTDQQISVLNQAINCDKTALCHTQEMSAKMCNCPTNGNGANGKFQRVITVRQEPVRGTPITSSAPGQKGKVYIIQNNSRPQPVPSGRSHDYTQDYNVVDDT